MTDLGGLLITVAASIREAMSQLDKTSQGILLLVDDDGRLLRVVTDGDLRRLLISGADLAATLKLLESRSALVLREDGTARQAMAMMNENQIDHVPVIDARGVPIRLFSRKDLDSRIYLSAPHLGGEERRFVEDAFRSNWIAPLGPNVDAFECEIAQYVGIGHATAVSSGTAALHLALRVVGVQRGDLVLCSTLTFVASANPILYQGATPVFIDSDPQTWNMSVPALRQALETLQKQDRRVRAAIVVSLYGQSADMDPIIELCDAHGVVVIEDAAESLGATYRGKFSGTLGKVGIFSFNGNKIITTSGGGMLISDDTEMVAKARFLATQARDPAVHYQHSELGYNYRMSNVLAGIGRGQLRVLEDRIARRRQVFDWYREYLSDVDALYWMPEAPFGRSTRWLSAGFLGRELSSLTPQHVIDALGAVNVEARPLWKPMHRQPLFEGAAYFPHSTRRSISDELFDRGLCLPSSSDLQEGQVAEICSTIRQAVAPTA